MLSRWKFGPGWIIYTVYINDVRTTVWLRVTTNIPVNSEIYVSYGRE